MRLIHTTFEKNRESIVARGLVAAYALSSTERVWFCKPFKGKWAVKHVCRRHREKAANVVVFVLDVPESWLHRYADGVYFTYKDIPPACIAEVRGSSPV